MNLPPAPTSLRPRPSSPLSLRPLAVAALVVSAWFIALAATIAGPGETRAPADRERWNVISIVTDDQAAWSLGSHGNTDARTPHLDRLARDGARFLNAFVPTPVCSPSRASFLTSRHGTQLGITDWITPREAARGVGLGPKVQTWPMVLRRHGYATGLIGKWHLGEQPQFHPTRLGFDHFEGALGGAFAPKDPELEIDGRTTKVPGHSADVVMDASLRFIEARQAQPFALLIHFREPHMPYTPVAPEDAAPFRELDPAIPSFPNLRTNQVKQWHREYLAAVHAVDRNVGRLLERLDALGLSRRTIVLFTSDHGYMIGHHGLHAKGNAHWIVGGSWGPKRPNLFEESIRVPLLVRWPGVVPPGTEIPEAVTSLDIFPSVLAMLNVPAPRGWKQEGVDFTPLLRGRRGEIHPAIFGQYDLHNGGLAFLRMVRADGWKLVRHHLSEGEDELYDLQSDPGESRNLYDTPGAAAMQARLQARLTAWQKQIRDPLLRRDP